MIRKIIRIDESKCNGCGACAEACHEGAIGMVNGKAKLLRDDYCDGLGDCLPACPTDAISFVEREAAAYDEAAVLAAKKIKNNAMTAATTEKPKNNAATAAATETTGCPGSRAKLLRPNGESEHTSYTGHASETAAPAAASQLTQWPAQIKLMPVTAPYYNGADLLIAADCTAYAYGNFHNEFMKNRITVIGCPKLDSVDYTEKLTAILQANDIKSVTLARMEVPCCGGLERAAQAAVQTCGKDIPFRTVVISTDGRVI